jgi:RNA polymerase sigma factor for flagellar operon FliA
LYGSEKENADERLIDGQTRDEACERYQSRIMVLARRLGDRLPPDCDVTVGDLASFGAIGLLEAFDRFDPEREILFSTFVEYRIRGAMMDALRQNDVFTRYRRQLARQIQVAEQELVLDLGRPPEHTELAGKLEMDLDTYWQVVHRTLPVSHISLYDNDTDGGEGLGSRNMVDRLMGSDGRDAFRNILSREAREFLKLAIKELPERRRQCVILYYGRGLNLGEIAQVFEVTPSRISQILSKARGELRTSLVGHISAGDLASKGDAGVKSI